MDRVERTCSVEGCTRTLTRRDAKGMCQAHYVRWTKYGDPGPAEIKTHHPGQACAVDECARRSYARGLCTTHYQRWRRWCSGENPDAVLTQLSSEEKKPHYRTAHGGVRRARGRAAEYPCQHCGGRAQEWAYDHADPDAVTVFLAYRQLEFTFSLDPQHYLALCASCHRKFDNDMRQSRPG